jgi:hypothetical protein
MFAMQGLRMFSLAPYRDSSRISCDSQGAFVGDVALLKHAQRGDGTVWTARPAAELNAVLTACYRLPIDVSAKVGALALIASALNRGDLAMAAIATVQMQFPDPPVLAKGIDTAEEFLRRAIELHRSHLLKIYWDPAKHPRAGTPPNPGWFAQLTAEPETANVVPAAMIGNRWDKPVIFDGGTAGGGIPRFSPPEPAPRPPLPPEPVAPPESVPQARRFPKLPPLPPPPGPGSGGDEYCFERHAIEYDRCDVFTSYSPRYRDACRARAADRRNLCVRNGGRPDPDEPPEFDWNDIPGDPATR